jgi:hydroxyacylglutathione hydrolase
MLILETRASPPFMKNGYVLGCDATREGVLIDPGDDVGELLEAVAAHRLDIKHILLTHAHLDHISGVARAKAALGAPVCLHPDDRRLYENVVQQGLAFGFQVGPQPPIDVYFDDGATFPFGGWTARVHHTPGHSPGGVCLEIAEGEGRGTRLIVGDTLFAGSIGRTDLPGGNLQTLLTSIRTVLFAFGDETIVYPGHGPETTIGRERRTNPFLTQDE